LKGDSLKSSDTNVTKLLSTPLVYEFYLKIIPTILQPIIIIIIIISNLSNDRSKASSKTIPPHSAI